MKFKKENIILSGLIFHLCAAYFSIGYHQCDEFFQVFEFAGYKLGLNKAEQLPWEFGAQIRSGIQPLFVFLISRLFYSFSIHNPFIISTVLRIIISIFSFLTYVKFISFFENEVKGEKNKSLLWFICLLFWCIPYYHTRLSSENVSSSFLLAGLNFFLSRKSKIDFVKLFFCGFLFGISFLVRFQMAFMIAGFFAWIILYEKVSLKFYFVFFSGLIFSIFLGLIVDKWFYGDWVLTWWRYLDVNFFQNKASEFGESPWYYYFIEGLAELIPPLSIILIMSMIYFWMKFSKHFLTSITLPFILLHFFVSHKELRFLFPVMNFLPLISFLCFQYFQEKHSYKIYDFFCRPAIYLTLIILNIILLISATFKPASDYVLALKKIYELSGTEKTILLYKNYNPYDDSNCLNYFRNSEIKASSIDSTINISNEKIFFYSEKIENDDTLRINKMCFIKLYSNFPNWILYFNFNNWLERANCFSIYQLQKPLESS